ncbi:MAG TPA: hypothetical protein VF765_23635 [Polyangiaceae bacterium]
MTTSRLPALVATFALGVVAGCGGRASQAIPEELAFHPQVGNAGYGAISGYKIVLTDPTTGGAAGTLTIQLSDIKDGSYAIDGGRSSALLVQTQGGVRHTFQAVSGTVTLKGSATKVTPAGSQMASWGSVLGHADLTLTDTAASSHEVHLSCDYVAGVTYVG